MYLWQKQYKQLPFGAALSGNMCQRKINKILKELPNVFVIANDISVIGYDNNGGEHERILCKVFQICRKENLKLNKDKFNLKCTSFPTF